MKILSVLVLAVCLLFSCSEEASVEVPASAKEYEVGCGLCVFDSDVPDSCESYVMIEGKTMPIVGEVLNAHNVGLCEYKGTAYLTGKVEDGKFMSEFMKIKEFDKSKNYQD